MRPVVLRQNGAGNSTAVPLDRYIAPFQVTVACVINGVSSYKLQYTYDDIFDSSVTPTWWDDTTIPAATAANAQTSYDNPISAVRLVVAAGDVTMTVNQAGIV